MELGTEVKQFELLHTQYHTKKDIKEKEGNSTKLRQVQLRGRKNSSIVAVEARDLVRNCVFK